MEVNQEMLRILDIKTKTHYGSTDSKQYFFLLVATVTYKDKVAVKPH